MKVRFTPSGRRQFLDAVAYIVRDDPVAARRFRQRVEAAPLVQAVGMALLLVVFSTVGAPRWLAMLAIALFAILWYAYVLQSRLADRASSLLAEVHRA